MEETEEEERNFNNVTMDTFFYQSPATNNTQGYITNVTSVHFTTSASQGEIASVTSERNYYLYFLEETIYVFIELTIKSTINDSMEDDTESDPNNDSKVGTHITNKTFPHKLLTDREIPAIIQGVIPTFN